MRKFYEWIVNHPKTILITTGILVILCAMCIPFIGVDYDMNDYLPEDTASTVALDVMDEEYDGGIPNARVMVEDVTIAEALDYKEKIQNVDGVSDVLWLDDSEDVTQPIEFMDTDSLETYYEDNNALFSVTIDEDKRISAVDEIKEIVGEKGAMNGSAVSAALATTSTTSEIQKIALIAVIFTLFVLTLTTTSYAEPVIVLLGIGVAVVINFGSNIMFGTISFVTNAAGNILQLAVSLDYSVFLIHRFEECRQTYSDESEAMVVALLSSTMSIMSSGLTTVIGFLALCLMQFGIGPDLGLALAKGIAISLLVVFIFMPVFILYTYKFIEKTKHKSFLPSFHKFGVAVTKGMIPAVVIFALLIVPCYLASNKNSFYYGSSHIFGNETQLGKDTEKIQSIFGKSDTYVLMVPKDSITTQKELSDALHDLPQVKNIVSYVDTVGQTIPEQYLDHGTLSQLNSDNYTRMVITVDAEYEGDETFDLVKEIRSIADDYYPDEWYLAGEGVSTYDLMDTITADMVWVNAIAIGAVFVVLLLSLKSISLPFVLVIAIETAIFINLSFPYFENKTIFYIAYLIISSIQLGATVDYAILFTDRYCGFRETLHKKEAVIETVSACAASIMTSASVLTVVGFLLGYISSHGILSQLGIFLGIGTLCSLTIVLFVLPGLLYLLDPFIQKTTKGIHFLNKEA